jgi:hypothetical protein
LAPRDRPNATVGQMFGRQQPTRSEWRGPALVAIPILLVTLALWFATTQPPIRDLIWSIPPSSPLTSTSPQSAAPTSDRSQSPERRVARASAALPARIVAPQVAVASAEQADERPDPQADDPTACEPATDAEQTEASNQSTPTAEATNTKLADGGNRRVARSPGDALELQVGQDFNQTRIQEVVDYLTESTGVTFQLDMKSLWNDQGTTRNVPVTIQSRQMRVREFLDEVVTQRLKAVYLVRDDKIVITSRKAANQSKATSKK